MPCGCLGAQLVGLFEQALLACFRAHQDLIDGCAACRGRVVGVWEATAHLKPPGKLSALASLCSPGCFAVRPVALLVLWASDRYVLGEWRAYWRSCITS